MITRTVKLPVKLVAVIDNYIRSDEYSTRADFVLHALRDTVHMYATKKIEILEKNKDDSRAQFIVSEFLNEITRMLLGKFLDYKGEQIQINTRIPEGLDRKIGLLTGPEIGYKNKSEFIRASVMYLLVNLSEIKNAFEDEERTVIRNREIADKVNLYLEKGFKDGKTVKEILDAVYEELKKDNYE